jgi:hypothetical protein
VQAQGCKAHRNLTHGNGGHATAAQLALNARERWVRARTRLRLEQRLLEQRPS